MLPTASVNVSPPGRSLAAGTAGAPTDETREFESVTTGRLGALVVGERGDGRIKLVGGSQVRLSNNIKLFDEAGRSNAETELALQASGGTRDLMIIGTVGA